MTEPRNNSIRTSRHLSRSEFCGAAMDTTTTIGNRPPPSQSRTLPSKPSHSCIVEPSRTVSATTDRANGPPRLVLRSPPVNHLPYTPPVRAHVETQRDAYKILRKCAGRGARFRSRLSLGRGHNQPARQADREL